MAISGTWSLTPAMRLGIALFVAGYLCATRPWSAGELGAEHYQVALAFLVMAAFPRGTRLAVAVGVTLSVLVAVTVALDVLRNG
jgi:hypothetical protein